MSTHLSPDLSGCVLRPAVASDMPGLLDFMRLVMPHDPRTPDYYRWQYLNGPAGAAEMRIIESEGQPVSLYVGTRKRLWVNGAAIPCLMVQDVMTHPAFRGRGFLNHMACLFMEEMRKGDLLGFTFPNKRSENSFRRSGWRELTPIPLRLASPRPDAPEGRVDLRPVDAFGPEAGAIWEGADLAVGVLRDADFLNWRYARPQAVYHRSVIGDDQGFLVLKLYRQGERRILHVCDLVTRKEARSLLPSILDAVHAFAARHGAALITCWLPDGHPYLPAYEQAGFRRDPDNDRFAFVHGDPDRFPQLGRRECWHLSQADNDIY